MTGYAEARRLLPRGWSHFALQFALWVGFYGIYQMARGAADGNQLSAQAPRGRDMPHRAAQ